MDKRRLSPAALQTLTRPENFVAFWIGATGLFVLLTLASNMADKVESVQTFGRKVC